MSRKVDQEDPFSGRGSYQEGRDNGATEIQGKFSQECMDVLWRRLGKCVRLTCSLDFTLIFTTSVYFTCLYFKSYSSLIYYVTL